MSEERDWHLSGVVVHSRRPDGTFGIDGVTSVAFSHDQPPWEPYPGCEICADEVEQRLRNHANPDIV